MAATQRVDFRIDPESRALIEDAARLVNVSLSQFVRAAVEQRADEVLRAQRETVVPPDFFDQLIAALDAPDIPNEPTRRAARRAREMFTD